MESPLDPELLREVTRRAKKQIRGRMRALRGGHPGEVLAEKSAAIVERLLGLEELASVRGVASFWPLVERGEVDLRQLDQVLRGRSVSLYYPFMDPKASGGFTTGFRHTSSSLELAPRGQGFFEPDPGSAVAAPGDVDVALVPALALDASGRRIGYGAGYYDATLGDICPPGITIAVAYDFQLLAELPSEEHDRPVDVIVTDRRTLRVS